MNNSGKDFPKTARSASAEEQLVFEGMKKVMERLHSSKQKLQFLRQEFFWRLFGKKEERVIRRGDAFWPFGRKKLNSKFELTVHESELVPETLEGEFWPKLFAVCVDPCEFDWSRFGPKQIGAPDYEWSKIGEQRYAELHPQ